MRFSNYHILEPRKIKEYYRTLSLKAYPTTDFWNIPRIWQVIPHCRNIKKASYPEALNIIAIRKSVPFAPRGKAQSKQAENSRASRGFGNDADCHNNAATNIYGFKHIPVHVAHYNIVNSSKDDSRV